MARCSQQLAMCMTTSCSTHTHTHIHAYACTYIHMHSHILFGCQYQPDGCWCLAVGPTHAVLMHALSSRRRIQVLDSLLLAVLQCLH